MKTKKLQKLLEGKIKNNDVYSDEQEVPAYKRQVSYSESNQSEYEYEILQSNFVELPEEIDVEEVKVEKKILTIQNFESRKIFIEIKKPESKLNYVY